MSDNRRVIVPPRFRIVVARDSAPLPHAHVLPLLLPDAVPGLVSAFATKPKIAVSHELSQTWPPSSQLPELDPLRCPFEAVC